MPLGAGEGEGGARLLREHLVPDLVHVEPERVPTIDHTLAEPEPEGARTEAEAELQKHSGGVSERGRNKPCTLVRYSNGPCPTSPRPFTVLLLVSSTRKARITASRIFPLHDEENIALPASLSSRCGCVARQERRERDDEEGGAVSMTDSVLQMLEVPSWHSPSPCGGHASLFPTLASFDSSPGPCRYRHTHTHRRGVRSLCSPPPSPIALPPPDQQTGKPSLSPLADCVQEGVLDTTKSFDIHFSTLRTLKHLLGPCPNRTKELVEVTSLPVAREGQEGNPRCPWPGRVRRATGGLPHPTASLDSRRTLRGWWRGRVVGPRLPPVCCRL